MIKLSNAQLWVHDQDEALDFYTKKLGMEVRSDVTLPEMGNFRWLTVGPAGQPDVAITLMAIPGPPVMDDATAEQVRSLVAKGFAGTIFLTTDDVKSDYEELAARDLERQPVDDDGVAVAFRQLLEDDHARRSAERRSVPLNTMCSMKCARPFCSMASRREPLRTHTPTETERT